MDGDSPRSLARRPLGRAAPGADSDHPATPSGRPLHLVSWLVDGSCLGGLSLALAALLYQLDGAFAPELAVAAGWLVWCLNYPHFAATNYRLYQSRAAIAEYRKTALGAPAVLLAAMVTAFAYPTTVAPWFIKLFLLWSPFHYSGQSVGLALLYARRAGWRVSSLERRALQGFVFGTFVVNVAAFESASARSFTYYDLRIPRLGVPEWVLTTATAGMYASGLVVLLVGLRWSWRARQPLPPIILLPALTQYVWFICGPPIPGYLEWVPALHGLQYLFIAWAMQVRLKMLREGRPPSRPYVAGESLRWLLANLALGGLLFAGLPELATRLGAPPTLAIPVVIAAIQIHHFLVDGVIWKLRSPTVAEPLMTNLGEMTGRRRSA